jgi:hypothetical protein
MNLRVAALAAGLSACAFAVLPAAAAPPHDGRWAVELVTENGWCSVHRWSIGVADGRITDVGAPGAVAAGRIDPAGRVSVRLARGDDVVSVSGAVKAGAGGGQWTLPNRSCSGRWSAQKVA